MRNCSGNSRKPTESRAWMRVKKQLLGTEISGNSKQVVVTT